MHSLFKRCETKFKNIQTAYSEIGDEESRRQYDLKQRVQQQSPFTSYTSSSNLNTDDILRAFFEEQNRYQRRRKPAVYFNGIDISNLFSSSNAFPFGNTMRNPFAPDETTPTTSSSPQPKSIYEQEISFTCTKDHFTINPRLLRTWIN